MNILHVIPGLDPMLGGPSEAVRHLARETAKLGHEVEVYSTVLSLNSGAVFPDPERFAPARVRVFPVLNIPHVLAFSLPLLKALAHKVPHVDIVHLHSLYFLQNAWAAVLCCQHKIPYLVRPHGTLDPYIRSKKWWLKAPYYHLIERWVLEHAAALHFTAEEEMRLTKDLGLKTPGIVVPNGIPEEAFIPGDPGLFFQKYSQLRGRRIILFLSRLHEKKGLDLLIPAFASVAKKTPNLHLVLAGPDDGFEPQTRKLVAEHGVVDQTLFTGMISGDLKRAAFAASECFVLPSYSENFGIVVLEAMAQKIPVLVSDKVNIASDLLQHGAGLVTKCHMDELVQQLGEVLHHRKMGRELGLRAHAFARGTYSWKTISNNILNEYCRLGAMNPK